MSDAFLFENFVDGNEDARLFHVAESVVDGGSEHSHCRAESHVGVDQWRYVESQFADFGIECDVVVFERRFVEKLLQFLRICFNFQRFHRDNEVFRVAEMLVEEVENHVASFSYVRGIHGYLSEEIFHVGHDDCQCAQSVP